MENKKPYHRTPKDIIVTVKPNPLDEKARKYIRLFGIETPSEAPSSNDVRKENALTSAE